MWWECKTKTLKMALTLALLLMTAAGSPTFGQNMEEPDYPPEDPCQTYNIEDGTELRMSLANGGDLLNYGNRHYLNVSYYSACLDLTFNCTDFFFPEDSLIVPWHPQPSPNPMGVLIRIIKLNPSPIDTSTDFELPFYVQEMELGHLITTVPDSAQTTFRLNTGTYMIEYLGLETDTGICAKRSELELTIEAVNPFPIPIDTLRGTSQGDNLVETFTSKNEDGTDGIIEKIYYDDYGRELQTVGEEMTPEGDDLVTMHEYDSFGHRTRSWLPVAVTGNGGAFVSPADFSSAAMGLDAAPYEETRYEASPLARPLSVVGAGQAWHSAGKGISTAYYTNISGKDSITCYLLKATDTGSGVRVNKSGNYATGTLRIIRTADADGQLTFEFKDRQEKTVLTRKALRRGSSRTWLNTYYVYDDFGRLCAVLPPAASEKISGTRVSDVVLEKYAYLYRYDHRHRVIAKKLPGAEWIEYCYDEADLPVLIQDGRQREMGTATFIFYDASGRETVMGTCNESASWMRPLLSGKYARTQLDADGRTYSMPADIPLQNAEIQKIQYYDGYDFANALGFPEPEPSTFSHEWIEPQGDGLLTGCAIAILDESGNSRMLHSRTIYDELTRLPVQSVAENQFGGLDIVNTTYDYMGRPVCVENTHTTNKGGIQTTITEEYSHTYDHAGRLLTTTYTLNGGTPVTLAANSYDELGRLLRVERADNPTLTTQYAYNLRSWTTEISSLLFSQQLFYNQSHNGSTPQWGGNVSAMDWDVTMGATTDKLMGYAFSYDNLSRLTQADYYENNDRSNHYDTRYSYDMMGNIVVLERNGLHDDGEFGLIDYLTFDYEGNQVTKVTDEVSDGPYRKDAWHYRDGSNREVEREYDGNGNLVKDSDAKISSIQYNLLNLPRMIKFSDGGKHIYTYDASGRKLRAEHHVPVVVAAEPQIPIEDLIPPNDNPEIPDDSEQMPYEPPQEWGFEHMPNEWEVPWQQFEEQVAPFICIMPPMPPDDEIIIDHPIPDDQPIENEVPCDVTATDYCGNFIYEDGTLRRILIPGGYVTFTSNNINLPEYHFYITDHQGNIRVVANQNGEVEQMNHYYPYGGLMGESTNSDAQPYKYNGKELDRHSGLDWYDYGARWYNGISWMTPDPLAEKYYDTSPYVYCLGNPVKYIDMDGRDVFVADIFAKRNITNTLSKEEARYVRFDDNGRLDVTLLNQYNGNSTNFAALRALANSETSYIFAVANKDINGSKFYEKGTNKEYPNNYSYGVTNMPGMEFNPSPNDNVYIFTAAFLDEKTQTRNTAHEGYGHAYFYELSKNNPSINPNHTKGIVGTVMEYDPDLKKDIPSFIFDETNTALENQIKTVEEQAIKNYEDRYR